MKDPDRDELASPGLQARIDQASNTAARTDATARAPAAPPSSRTLRYVSLGLAVVICAGVWVRVIAARPAGPSATELQRGMYLQAQQVRGFLLTQRRLPRSLDEAGQIDPTYELVPLGEDRFAVRAALDDDEVLSVEASSDSPVLLWSRGAKAR